MDILEDHTLPKGSYSELDCVFGLLRLNVDGEEVGCNCVHVISDLIQSFEHRTSHTPLHSDKHYRDALRTTLTHLKACVNSPHHHLAQQVLGRLIKRLVRCERYKFEDLRHAHATLYHATADFHSHTPKIDTCVS